MKKITRKPNREKIENGLYEVYAFLYLLFVDDVVYTINLKDVDIFKQKKEDLLSKLYFIFEYDDKDYLKRLIIKTLLDR